MIVTRRYVPVVVQVRKHVMEEVNKAGKAKKLRGFEMIKSVWLDEEAWSGKGFSKLLECNEVEYRVVSFTLDYTNFLGPLMH